MITTSIDDARVLDALGVAVIVTDLDGVVVMWNRAAHQLYGWSAQEALGRNVVDFMPAPEVRERAAEIMAALARGETWSGVFHLQRKDGSTFLGRVTDRPLLDESGDLAGVVGLSEDLSGDADPAIRTWMDGHRLELALEAARMGTWEWRTADDAITWDEQFERIAGLQPGSFGGSVKAWLDLIHPEDRLRALEEMEQADLEHRGSFTTEFRMVRPDGSVRWVESRGTALTAPDVGVVGAVGVVVDVTDRKAIEEERQRLTERLRSLATTLQESLLPPSLPELPGVEAAAAYEPAGGDADVGGDFYDVVRLDGAFGTFIGDVCGKGAPAARLTALTRYTLRVAAHQHAEPTDVLSVLNDTLLREAARHADSGDRLAADCRFVTAVYARVTPVGDALHVRLSRAGHEAPYVLRADASVEEVGEPGMLLGVVDRPRLTTSETWLGVGDVLLLYTDGAVDPRARNRAPGEDPLGGMLRTLAGRPAEDVVRRVAAAVVESTPVRRDDVAFLAIRARPS